MQLILYLTLYLRRRCLEIHNITLLSLVGMYTGDRRLLTELFNVELYSDSNVK